MYILFKDRPVYTLPNGRSFQLNEHGVAFCVSDIQPDPHFPGMMDLTDAICSPTRDETRQVKEMASPTPA